MEAPRYYSAEEAARELGVKAETVYAYVSRGLIRSEPTGTRTRERRYHAEDVRTLKERKARGRSPAAALQGALDWGAPLMDSALTLITERGLFYRGVDATLLAETHTLEEVALLLWGSPRAHGLRKTGPLPALVKNAIRQFADLAPIDRMQALIPVLAAVDPGAHDHTTRAIVETGITLVRALARAAVGTGGPTDQVARILLKHWAPNRPGAERLLSAALVLCADHELNTSTLAARCAASTRASLYGVVSAGMATLQGVFSVAASTCAPAVDL